MAYDPPEGDGFYREAYDEGYEAARAGKSIDDNPFKPSGHERDTTYQDEMHYHWWSGFFDFEKPKI